MEPPSLTDRGGQTVQRPIFIDFETNGQGEPFLAAVNIDSAITQYVLCQELAPLTTLQCNQRVQSRTVRR